MCHRVQREIAQTTRCILSLVIYKFWSFSEPLKGVTFFLGFGFGIGFCIWVCLEKIQRKMTSSSEFCEFSGQRQGKLPEKASFSQRCSLLSQYLKEKGSFGDLSLGLTCNIESNGTFFFSFFFFFFFGLKF